MSGANLDLARRALLISRLPYHLHCLREDATDPEMTALERLALVRERVRQMREIRAELEESGLAADISENLDPAATEYFA